MHFDLDHRSATLSVGEFAEFSIGPRDSVGGHSGLWRAQIGTEWHQQLHLQTRTTSPDAVFEVPIRGAVAHRGWVLTLTGRIDQILPSAGTRPRTLREIKTITSPLPADEASLRALYPDYLAQLATYLALTRIQEPDLAVTGQLLFVEIGAGTIQTVAITRDDEIAFTQKLENVVVFLEQRWKARERLKNLTFHSPFAHPRPGQEHTLDHLQDALRNNRPVAFEAPTGFGKTGLLLQAALGQLRDGHINRVIYLTSKSTGQLQVVRTLQQMTAPDKNAEASASETNTSDSGERALATAPQRALAVWQVRAKAEHCINTTFHCVSEQCGYLANAAARWPQSGLSRFYLFEDHPRDLEALRSAGRDAHLCPYEITRTALAFNDVWIGDYNYVFAPRNRSLFYEQPGFDPGQTLLIVDEAHNLPTRVADSYSHTVHAESLQSVLWELEQTGASTALRRAWSGWAELVTSLTACEALDLAVEDDVTDLLQRISECIGTGMADFAEYSAAASEQLWQTADLYAWVKDQGFPKLLWCPRAGELRFTCLDAAQPIGTALKEYGAVILASATFGPLEAFTEAVGLQDVSLLTSPTLDKRSSEVGESTMKTDSSAALSPVTAHTPWREGAYDVAYDLRVDTRFNARSAHAGTTATSIETLQAAAGSAVVVFFSSYRYAESIQQVLDQRGSPLKIALQPRGQDLAAQAAWVDESLLLADALFLVLGSSFAESIDLLGGRVSHALVVGPALPEVNAVQKARLDTLRTLSKDEAFRRVYQIPGMQKVNQALGRLVRAPGQKARVILQCRRFGEVSYASLLAPDYQFGTSLTSEADLNAWLRPTSD